MDITEPSFTTNDTGEIQGNAVYIYGLGLFFGFFILIILIYVSYICKRHMCSPSPPQPTTNDAAENHQFVTFSPGVDDDVIVTFPTFVYSEFMMPSTDSGCYIRLTDYKPVDTIRLLPECGHLFHIGCIDTWLRVHPTCPVCRKSLVADIVTL
ncbi:hypothetical protein L1987_25262 [Smallanthus sonchifolius]|uniref:Uncharacterized protein n=1 Tax=Smallanthus sonchifolius TaxID=185202 RepID=A0ACB9IP62_9ASTR|nr:hypothetical protein L1987_25262 [Smallanthus sonchifolius]